MVLSVAAEHALMDDLSFFFLIIQRQSVHISTFESMKGLRAISALDCGTRCIATEARKRLLVNELIQGLTNVDPFALLNAVFGVLIILDAFLMEVQRGTDHFLL